MSAFQHIHTDNSAVISALVNKLSSTSLSHTHTHICAHTQQTLICHYPANPEGGVVTEHVIRKPAGYHNAQIHRHAFLV